MAKIITRKMYATIFEELYQRGLMEFGNRTVNENIKVNLKPAYNEVERLLQYKQHKVDDYQINLDHYEAFLQFLRRLFELNKDNEFETDALSNIEYFGNRMLDQREYSTIFGRMKTDNWNDTKKENIQERVNKCLICYLRQMFLVVHARYGDIGATVDEALDYVQPTTLAWMLDFFRSATELAL